MKHYLPIAFGILLFGLAALNHTCNSTEPLHQSPLVIAAVVQDVGKHPGASSGYYQIYQLVKYKVVTVCASTLDQNVIIVDHLLVSGDELKSLHIGDKVYLTLSRSKSIPMRFNEDGFRNPSDNVEIFYIGNKPEVMAPVECKK